MNDNRNGPALPAAGDQHFADPLEQLRQHPAAAIRATTDPTPKGPVDYVLVHWHPSRLLPVRHDKRIREGPEWHAYFTRFTADVRTRGVMQPVIAVAEGDAARTVDGETRRQAALLAGLDSVPVLVYQRELTESELKDKPLKLGLCGVVLQVSGDVLNNLRAFVSRVRPA